jgi:hypothetical protein
MRTLQQNVTQIQLHLACIDAQEKHLERCREQSKDSNHTTSFHFFIVSRFPRLSSAFLALAEKLSVDKVLDKFEALGLTCTISKIFELLPAPMKVC